MARSAGVVARERRNKASHGRVAVTVERAQVDRVCGPSKQIIVTQKQDCSGFDVGTLSARSP
jgi:hypothetical protein